MFIMNRIREYRRKNNITTTELGKLIGLSQSTISKIENGQTSPKVEWLEKITDVFGCTVNDLVDEPKEFKSIEVPSGFFRNEKLKKLRNIAGGETYTAIYLKLLLLSANTDGHINYKGLDTNLYTELAMLIDEKAYNIEMCIHYLEANNLLLRKSSTEITLKTRPK